MPPLADEPVLLSSPLAAASLLKVTHLKPLYPSGPINEHHGQKRCFVEDDDTSSTRTNMSISPLAKKQLRTQRNRESAQRSRNNKKARLAQLESDVFYLKAENARLHHENEELRRLMQIQGSICSFSEENQSPESSLSEWSDVSQATEELTPPYSSHTIASSDPSSVTETPNVIEVTATTEAATDNPMTINDQQKPAVLSSLQLEALMIIAWICMCTAISFNLEMKSTLTMVQHRQLKKFLTISQMTQMIYCGSGYKQLKLLAVQSHKPP